MVGFVVPNKVINYRELGDRCLLQHWTEPDAAFTVEEYAHIVALKEVHEEKLKASGHRYAEDVYNPGYAILDRDLNGTVELPKWAAFYFWLQSDGLARLCPELAADIAILALEGNLGRGY